MRSSPATSTSNAKLTSHARDCDVSGAGAVPIVYGAPRGEPPMRLKTKIAAVLLGLAALPAVAWASVIGGTYYAPQDDYRAFFAAADGRNFPVSPHWQHVR